jgi:hypothetical protein
MIAGPKHGAHKADFVFKPVFLFQQDIGGHQSDVIGDTNVNALLYPHGKLRIVPFAKPDRVFCHSRFQRVI